jgi:hypothetical protein
LASLSPNHIVSSSGPCRNQAGAAARCLCTVRMTCRPQLPLQHRFSTTGPYVITHDEQGQQHV